MDAIDTNQTMELRDYLAILRRRKKQVLGVMVLVFLSAAISAFFLPSVYRSSAVILIENQEIPEELVATTVKTDLQERIQGVMLRLLTHDSLWRIIEKLDLYPEQRKTSVPEQVVKLMRRDVGIEITDFQVAATDDETKGISTVALNVFYNSDSPVVAQKAASEIANIFLEVNRKARTETAAAVSKFLGEEAERLRAQITDLEKNLAVFKQENVDQLPQLSDLNTSFYEQTDEKIERTEENIRSLEDRLINLEAQLAVTNPYQDVFTDGGARVQGGGERLSVLMAEYLRMSSIYSSSHPDVSKLKREIVSLEGQLDGSTKASSLVGKATLLREQLSEARQKYSSEHPDVQKLNKSLSAVERELRELSIPRSRGNTGTPTAPDNPSYISLKTQLDTVLANLAAEKEKKSKLVAKLEKYEARLFKTPTVERDYLTLTRDYDNAVKKYNEVKSKQQQAQMGFALESAAKGQRFTLVEPPRVPSEPFEPNRPAILFIGVVLGFICGIGTASVVEYMDGSVRGLKGVANIFNAPPLATIPYIKNSHDIARVRRQKMAAISVIILTLLGAIVLTLLYANLASTETPQEVVQKS